MADVQVDKSIMANSPTCMESVNRFAKLPVVESTIQTASNLYEKVRDYNSVTHWTCSTAENCVHKAVEVGKPLAVPIVQGLEGPIKKVDGVLCSGLDYVETKLPAVKLPPGELFYQLYTTTKDYVNSTVTPVVENAYSYVEPAVKSAYGKIEPAVQSAKTVVEPLVEPVLEKARVKIDQMLHPAHHHDEGIHECDECKRAAENNEHSNNTEG